MKNKQIKQQIAGTKDGFKNKFWHSSKLMFIEESIILKPKAREVCFFDAVSLNSRGDRS